jgi:hypothetical protein
MDLPYVTPCWWRSSLKDGMKLAEEIRDAL